MEVAWSSREDRVEMTGRWHGDHEEIAWSRSGAERDVAALLTTYYLLLTTHYLLVTK